MTESRTEPGVLEFPGLSGHGTADLPLADGCFLPPDGMVAPLLCCIQSIEHANEKRTRQFYSPVILKCSVTAI